MKLQERERSWDADMGRGTQLRIIIKLTGSVD